MGTVLLSWGAPSSRAPWGEAPSPTNLTFRLLQCKLEQQACLSSKQLTVRCEGPCPCPTEQATTSTTDGKPGNAEHWATASMGWGGPLCQGSWLAREVFGAAREKWQNRDWPGVGAGLQTRRAWASAAGLCCRSVVLGSEGRRKMGEGASNF